ncbi:sterile alpha motif domain-containing protein 9-like isoform X2 [Chelmon rostratus]|uniref:sterile alpha motif domain-containing protein 9-like isoform X2 n=1 Tax=Chelmon rostratus TaxID=109905 RepID=UPI001BEA4408|nr:sterile alpha motif domain-containing protein 9-like isoform X2 [Chelmon rostratus]
MAHSSTESVVRDSTEETFVFRGEELTAEEFTQMQDHLFENVSESYLLMPECLQILGPPDPIHGGPPFEARMEPFTDFINASGSNPERVCMIHPVVAQGAVKLLADSGISRSATVKTLMFPLCGYEPQPHIIQFIKDLLTKRELGDRGKQKFSQLIEDIKKYENFYNAVSVLKTASKKFGKNAMYPQTLSRLYYIERCNGEKWREITNSQKAEKWAKEAIKRAPGNSFVADTLGQVYKSRLRKAKGLEDILQMTDEAFQAFKDVERKADREEGPEMDNTAGVVSTSNSFNNRGLFGYVQVAKIAFEKRSATFIPSDLVMGVEAKFDFFEWYLTYSMPDMSSLEPKYFWEDVVLCYRDYTTKTASESTSFPGLLDHLNRGLFMSKGRRAGFEETEETVSDLETVRDFLKTTYEANVDDVKAAERYILSNIILSNKIQNSPQLTVVTELQTIIVRYVGAEVGRRSPEFYLLVLLLFWPEEQPLVAQEEDDEEVERQSAKDDGSEDRTSEDEEQETRGETVQPSPKLLFDLDLQQQVTFMKEAFERAKYGKYLRGRYLLPLFFLGKGSGLSKWIHKSRLDAILEQTMHAERAVEKHDRMKKERQISEMWVSGEVWQIPEIQDILLPVQVELGHPPMPQEHEEQEVFVCAGGRKIVATVEAKPEGVLSPMLFYLGFTIKGPVVFKVGFPQESGQ